MPTTDRPRPAAAQQLQVNPLQPHGATAHRRQPHQGTAEGALAAARGTHQADGFAAVQLQAHPIHRLEQRSASIASSSGAAAGAWLARPSRSRARATSRWAIGRDALEHREETIPPTSGHADSPGHRPEADFESAQRAPRHPRTCVAGNLGGIGGVCFCFTRLHTRPSSSARLPATSGFGGFWLNSQATIAPSGRQPAHSLKDPPADPPTTHTHIHD